MIRQLLIAVLRLPSLSRLGANPNCHCEYRRADGSLIATTLCVGMLYTVGQVRPISAGGFSRIFGQAVFQMQSRLYSQSLHSIRGGMANSSSFGPVSCYLPTRYSIPTLLFPGVTRPVVAEGRPQFSITKLHQANRKMENQPDQIVREASDSGAA